MKKFAVILALSLAANVALVAAFFVRPRPAPVGTGQPSSGVSEASSRAPGKLDTAQLSALRSDDVAQWRAAGVPEEMINALLVGRAYAKLQARSKAARTTVEEGEQYWKTSTQRFQSRTKEQRIEMIRAQREFTDALRAALGEEANGWGGSDPRYGFLPAAKREQLRQIDQDYAEMQSEVYSDINGIQLASDREKLRLLEQERERDLAGVLTPEELEQYNLRISRTAMNVRSRYGDAIQSEADYRKIYALQKAYDDKYRAPDFVPGAFPDPAAMRERREAEQALQDSIRAAMGEENYAAFQRANDPGYKALTTLVKRLSLPANTIESVQASRNDYALLSQQINQNAALTSDQRRAQLRDLGKKARGDLQASLGKEGADAYAQRADWVTMLSNGTAFSTDAKAASSSFPGFRTVVPLPPPGTPSRPSVPPKS